MDLLSESFENSLKITASRCGNLFREENRLKTFVNWKHDFIDKYELAMLGYCFVEPPDTIVCIFCGHGTMKLEPYDKVFILHFSLSSECPLLNFLAYENVPLDPERLDHALLSASYDTCSSCKGNVLRIDRYDRKWEVHIPKTCDYHLRMDIQQSIYPQYDTLYERHKSYLFCGWKYKKNPVELTDPGFFYTKEKDKVTCFCCGVTVSGWKVEDCPWEIHAYASGNCEFVRRKKGQTLIDHVKVKFANMGDILNQRITNKPTSSSTASVLKSNRTTAGSSTSSSEAEASSNKTCNICLDREYNMAFAPCGHVVTCEDCASSLSTCPVCRKTIISRTKVYLG